MGKSMGIETPLVDGTFLPEDDAVQGDLEKVGIRDPQPNNVPSPIESIISDTEKTRFVHQIRDQLYYIEIMLYNQLEDQKPFGVPFLFVHSLAFEETLHDWNTKGWIVFDDKFEVMTRGSNTDDANIKPPYIFRTDGRNRISFKIYPVPNSNSYSAGLEASSLDKEQWEMAYDCVIYDIEDMPVGNNQNKLRKYYFWDARYQFFLERNIEWSSRLQGINTYVERCPGMNYLLQKEPSQMTDFESSIPANIAIRSIIDTAALVDPLYENERGDVVKIGYTEGFGTIDKPNIPLNTYSIFWENGYVDANIENNNHIFYTSPANANVLDDLEYVLQNAVSSEGYPVFLRYGRNSGDYIDGKSTNKKNKQWELISLKTLLNNAKNEQVERLFIEDGLLSKEPYYPRAPLYGDDVNNFVSQNFTSGIASRIKAYKFSPMVSLDDMKIVNRPLCYYNFNDGTFNIKSQDNTAKATIDKFTDAAKDNLYSFEMNKDAHLLTNLNKTKQKGISTKPALTYRPFVPNNLPQIEMMKNLLFLNQAINFVSNGLTIRTPGKFIFIDSAASNGQKNAFNDRFLGQWIMTKVVHLFSKDNYLTEVVATKVDAFNKIWEVEDKNL
jgi:hypothetical protein